MVQSEEKEEEGWMKETFVDTGPPVIRYFGNMHYVCNLVLLIRQMEIT